MTTGSFAAETGYPPMSTNWQFRVDFGSKTFLCAAVRWAWNPSSVNVRVGLRDRRSNQPRRPSFYGQLNRSWHAASRTYAILQDVAYRIRAPKRVLQYKSVYSVR
ncbi:hypothetical protein SBC1_70930 (plasmid) [Caballeronia sp. SBC1]|nr:hypothetical protein SBC2_70670 [Caballeronia sp. SBC2]QIN67046.1 hypothetical protein SBC1_70930 [Caballeronia sp. SBC1]